MKRHMLFVVAAVALSTSAGANAKAPDTARFQAAIDAAAAKGGGRVVVPAGEWTVGTLWLKSNVELHLEKGAVLNASLDKADYNANDAVPLNFWSDEEEWSGGHLILCNAATNVAITGGGTLHGHGAAFFGGLDPKHDPSKNPHCSFPYYRYGLKLHPKDRTWFRPGPLLAFFVSKDVRLDGVTIRESPCWTVHFRGCDGVDIRGVSILNDRTIANSDGFSIDCTKNVTVADCRVSTGDDGFAIRASGPLAETHPTENVRVKNCRVASCCFGARIGVGTGTIRDLVFEDCDFEEAAKNIGLTPAWGFSQKYVSIEDVAFRNCTMRNAERPLEVHVVPRWMNTRGITFDNCHFEALSPILLPECNEPGFCENNYLRDFLFRRCTFKALQSVPGMRTTPAFKGPDIAEKGYVILDGEGRNIRFEDCDFPVRYVDPAAPRTWWHWMNGNVSKEGITADLEAMAKAGLGGATIFDADCKITPGKVDFATPEWFDAVDHAGREAKRLGLELTLANCSGWSSTGGPWVSVEESMKMTTLSETRVKGGEKFFRRLAQPLALGGFYRDIAVLAVPIPAAERRDAASARPKVAKVSELERIFAFDAPFAASSVRCDFDYTPVWTDAGPMRVSVSDDGSAWREIHKTPVWLSSRQTGFFQPRYYPLPEPVTAKFFRVAFAFPGAGGAVKLKDCSVEPRASLLDLYAKAYCRQDDALRSDTRTVGTDHTVRPDGVLDLTSRMGADGTLDWDAPAGDWQVVRLGYTSTLCRNHPATPKGRGFEADKFDAAAMARHFDAYVGKVLARAGTNSAFKAVLIDSCETGSQNWTAAFPDEFRRRRGYDMTPWYPVMAGFVVGSVAETEKFLADWRQTADELYAEKCIGTLREKCRERGMRLEVQPYGSFPCTTEKVTAACDIPMTEFWSASTKGPLFADTYATPQVMSAARKAGKALVDAEAFTANPADGGRWRTSPRDLKVMGDRAYAEGVNRFTFHRFAHQPAAHPKLPGMTMGSWGFHFDRTQTWWPYANEWLAYLTRCQRHLQAGAFVAAQPATNGLAWIRRKMPDGSDCFFLALANATNETRVVTLPVTGRFPHVFEPEANRAYRPRVWTDDGKATRIRVTFPAFGSAFVFFREKRRVDLPVEEELVTVSEKELGGAWRVDFPVDWYSGGTRVKSVTMNTLADWTTFDDPELKFFSGTATYAYDLDAPERVPSANERIELDLGAVDVFAEVSVNDRTYPVLWKPPYRLDITDALRLSAGRGEAVRLRIRVTNLWPNRLIGDAALLAAQRRTETAWPHWKADDEPLASGLHGPVRLITRRHAAPDSGRRVFSVRDFGAKGDGTTVDTKAIQSAVDAAAKAGGGTVEVGAGTYVSGSVFLKSNVDFHVGPGATLKGSGDRADYNAADVCVQNAAWPGENSSGAHLLLCLEQTNVVVRGEGTIDGNGAHFTVDPKTGTNWPMGKIPWRPSQMLYFVECRNVRVEGLRLVNSPYWTCFFHGCNDVVARGLEVKTSRSPRTWNGDGIDVDCCQFVRISDCVIETDDDSITLRADPERLKHKQDCAFVTVENCVLSSVCNAIRLGVGEGTVRDAVFSNLVIRSTKTAIHFAPGYAHGHGTDIRNCRFSNIRLDCDRFCVANHQFSHQADIRDIFFNGVSGVQKDRSILWAVPEKPFGLFSFTDVNVNGGIEAVNAPNVRIRGGSFVLRPMPKAEYEKLSDDLAHERKLLW